MSKLCDVRSMYGQDFGVIVTNAPSNVIQTMEGQLPKNMVLISSHNTEENNDDQMPAIFATDYNGNPLRLTYAIHTINGLYPNNNGELELHIDGKSIQENNDNKLYVDTNNLTYCSFNNLGVSKVAKSLISRANSSYPIDTFINVDKNGVLYVSDSFLEYMYKYVAEKIYKNLYVIIMDNVKGWLSDVYGLYYPSDRMQILPISPDNIIITKAYTLYYKSLSGVPEEVNIDINNNDYPIKEVVMMSNSTSVEVDSQSTTEITLYRHSIDFTITFYPNYNLQNGRFLKNQYYIKVQPQTFEDNQFLLFYFDQNNVCDEDSNVNAPFTIETETINLNSLYYNQDIEFSFNNKKYKYFEDVQYTLEIYYVKSNSETNTDDAIKIVSKNINEDIKKYSNYLVIPLSYEDGKNDIYEQLKNYLYTVETISKEENDTDFNITKLSDSSNIYKYILRYDINGERTYTYEKIFNIKYELTNLYVPNNYMEIRSIMINKFEDVSVNNENNQNNGIFPKYASKYDDNNVTGFDITYDKNNIYIEFNNTGITNLFSNLSYDTENNKELSIISILGGFIKPIFITNAGISGNDIEYSIYDPFEYENKTLAQSDINYYSLKQGDNVHIHRHQNEKNYACIDFINNIYPLPSEVSTRNSILSILYALNVKDFIFQNSNSRTHSSNTNILNYGFSIYNIHGPNINLHFTMDYTKFFNDNIKVFDNTFGHYGKPRLSTESISNNNFHITNNILLDDSGNEPNTNEITDSIYYNTLFFIAISEDLYKIMSNVSITANCTYKDNTTTTLNIMSGEIKGQLITQSDDPSLPYQLTYKGKKYYVYVIEYSKLAYVQLVDTGSVIFEPILEQFSKILSIEYTWKYQNNNDASSNASVKNTFNYELGFDVRFDSNETQAPNITSIG